MRVLVACEESQQVTLALRQRGIEAWSCDLEPGRLEPRWHIQDDARKVIRLGWDGLIAHPVCDRLTNAGVRWLNAPPPGKTLEEMWEELRKGAEFFKVFLDSDIPVKVIENPIPHKYAVERIGRKYDQLTQPHHFGDPFFKATCWWLENVPKLKRTHWMKVPKKKDEPERHKAWSKVHLATPGPDRKRIRSETFPGVAGALADLFATDLAVAA